MAIEGSSLVGASKMLLWKNLCLARWSFPDMHGCETNLCSVWTAADPIVSKGQNPLEWAVTYICGRAKTRH
jgi:hypothetical protein